MTIYMTKVWGFRAPVGPLQFSTQGWRDRARADLKAGDLVILVGTKTENTDPGERGRVLGVMGPTSEVVMSIDFEMHTRPADFDDEGHYRWPYGLLNRRAWLFAEPRPLLEEISAREFYMDSALGLVELTASEAAVIEKLPRKEVELLAPTKAYARVHGNDAARRRGAPPPTTTRRGVMHLRAAPAYTYLMKIEGAAEEAYKIGWAFDYRDRERGFNFAALPQLGGLRYCTLLFELWGTARQAFGMEQALLREFNAARHPANREVIHGITYEKLQAAWITALQRVRLSARTTKHRPHSGP
jgi:hypothetical protein